MLLIVLAGAFLAFTASAVAGGGASVVLVPLLAMALPIESVPAALSIGTGASSISRIATFRRAIRWDISRVFVPAAIPAAALGAVVLRYVNPAYVQLGMALFLVASLRRLVRPDATPAPTVVSGWMSIAGVGAAAGFLSGLTGAVGVVFNGFYLERGLSKDEIVATRAANDVLIHLVKLGIYAHLGLLTSDAWALGGLTALAAVLSAVALKPLLTRISTPLFARIGYGAMVLSGVALLWSSVENVVSTDRIAIDHRPVLGGSDTTLHWRDTAMTLEFEWDEGLEVELPLDAADLTDAQRALVEREDPGSDAVLLESVYGGEDRHIEAYYVREGRVVRRIEFDLAAQLDTDP